jgi:hypothetical protein
MLESLRSYRPNPKKYKDEMYYPLGDVIMAPVKTNPDVKQDFIYGPSHKLSNSNGKTIGPNKENVVSYYKYCSPKRKVQFFWWVYENNGWYVYIVHLCIFLKLIKKNFIYFMNKMRLFLIFPDGCHQPIPFFYTFYQKINPV